VKAATGPALLETGSPVPIPGIYGNVKNMDVRLKVFCSVAETKSFSKASRIAHLTQPAISLQIQALEELFETKLFDRSEGKVELTSAGKIFYREAKHILQHYADLEKQIGKITGMVRGDIALGASISLGDHVLPRLIIDFKKKHPKVKINMLVGNTKRIEDLLLSGLIDIGMVAGDASRNNIKAEPIVPDELVLIVPRTHPLVKKKMISVLEVAREPFILREEGSGTRRRIDEYLARHGVSARTMHIALVLGSTESIKEAVEAGIGISFVSKWAVKKEVEDGRLKALTLIEGRILRDLFMILPNRVQPSHVIADFILFVKKYPYESIMSE